MSPQSALRTRIHELALTGQTNRQIGAALKLRPGTVQSLRASMPFSDGPQPPAKIPPLNWQSDQPPPPATPEFRPGYHDHTFRSFSAPQVFEGWSIERVRNAIALHDQGLFLESSLLSLVVTRFGPVFAALSQAIAPALALPRLIRGGVRGLGKMLREEIEQQLAPRSGLLPSKYFPPTLWGSIGIDLRTMGFSVLQHVYGEPDPETGVRPIYTRRWPTWAVQYYRYRRAYVAITTEGPIDIISGDGKFTLIGDTEEPHFDGAIRALGLEVLDGTLAKQARAQYIDRYGDPKWVATMPPNTAVAGPEGDAMFEAMQTIQGPDGWGVLPHGATFEAEQMTASQNSVFESALDNVWQFIAAIVLGSDGTLSKGSGVYTAPMFQGVARSITRRILIAIARGINMGHVAPWLDLNYAASIANDNSGWIEPVLDIPLPDPDADERIKSLGERTLLLHQIVTSERAAGFIVTQERVDELSKQLDIDAPLLADMMTKNAIVLAPTDVAKIVRVDEGRASLGIEPVGDERGQLMIIELEERAKPAPAGAAVLEPEDTANSAAPPPVPATAQVPAESSAA